MKSKSRKLGFIKNTTKYEALDKDAQQQPIDWHTFARENRSIPLSMLFGTLFCMTAVGYTAWLSQQILFRPSWALDAKIDKVAKWNAENLALVQGFVTIFYALGLYSIAYAAQTIAETAIWPLHSRKPLALDQMDTYLLTVRGSVPPLAELIRLCDSLHRALFLVASILVFLTPLAAAPLVGSVYARMDSAHAVKSPYRVGGGVGRMFAQTNPPVSVGAESLAAYISWSRGLSEEPLPELRDWIIDRTMLKNLGDLTARAVRVQHTNRCVPFALQEIKSPGLDVALFETNMAKENYRNRLLDSSDNVKVRLAETMAVWADTFDFVHTNRSSVRIVFAAFNGTIESGISAVLSKDAYHYPTTVSSIACDVDVEFIDDTLVIGKGGPPTAPVATLSSIEKFHISFPNSSNASENTLNENTLWSAAATLLVCPSVDGAQPMYYRDHDSNSSLPTGYTKAPFRTYEAGLPDNSWTLEEISNFIHVAVGATAMASAQNFRHEHPEPAIITSYVTTRKLNPDKVIYLGIPVIVIVVGEVLLMYWNVVLHRQEGITVMRMARISDILETVRPLSAVELQKIANGESRAVKVGDTGWGSRKSSLKGVTIEVRDAYDDDDDEIGPLGEPVRDVQAMMGPPASRSRESVSTIDEQPEYLPLGEPPEIEKRGFFKRKTGVREESEV